MRVQINHVGRNGLFHGTKVRVTFHFARLAVAFPLGAFHPKEIVVTAGKFRGAPSAFRCRHRCHHAGRNDVYALKQRVPGNTFGIAVPADFVRLSDFLQTCAFSG